MIKIMNLESLEAVHTHTHTHTHTQDNLKNKNTLKKRGVF